MREMVEEAYVLSVKELIIILKGMNYKKCFGLMEREAKLEQEEIIKSLHKMTANRILSSNGEEFIVLQPYREIVLGMAEAEYVVVLHDRNGGEDTCYYIGKSEDIIKCGKNLNGNQTYRISILPKKQFTSAEFGIEELKGEELNKKLFSEEENVEKGIYGDFFENLEQKENIVSMTEVIQISGDINQSILVIDDGLTSYMMISDNCGIRREPYSFKRYLSLINAFTGGMVF